MSPRQEGPGRSLLWQQGCGGAGAGRNWEQIFWWCWAEKSIQVQGQLPGLIRSGAACPAPRRAGMCLARGGLGQSRSPPWKQEERGCQVSSRAGIAAQLSPHQRPQGRALSSHLTAHTLGSTTPGQGSWHWLQRAVLTPSRRHARWALNTLPAAQGTSTGQVALAHS